LHVQLSDCYAERVTSTKLTDTEMRAWQALLHAHHQVVDTLDRELEEEHDLNLAEYDVLLRLARSPERALRMTELAERVLMSPSGLTRLIDRLETRRLVERREALDDGRVTFAGLTEAGRRALRSAARTHLRGIRRHFTSLLTQKQLRDVAASLEVVAGPHAPH
jgi:DNA-binding MarR family transcriptional regulator